MCAPKMFMPSEIGAAPTCTRMTAFPWAQAHSLLPGPTGVPAAMQSASES